MLLWLLGCGAVEVAEADLLVEDVEEMARVLGAVADAPSTFESCVDGPGACSTCVAAEGTPVAGTWAVSVAPLPCEISADGATGRRATTVLDAGLDGTWSGSVTGLAVDAVGFSTRTLSGDAAENGEGAVRELSIVGSLEVDLAGEVVGFEVSGTYVGVAGRQTTFEASEVDGVLDGTLVTPNATCSVGGTRSAPTVDCGT